MEFYLSICIRCVCPGSCDPVKGTCSCPSGFRGPNCIESCPKGRYGPKCLQTCHCMNSASCNHVSGTCTCAPGWSGENCTERCPTGHYGLQCASKCQCSMNGTEVSTCDSVTGECNCRPGYRGYRYESLPILLAIDLQECSVCWVRLYFYHFVDVKSHNKCIRCSGFGLVIFEVRKTLHCSLLPHNDWFFFWLVSDWLLILRSKYL